MKKFSRKLKCIWLRLKRKVHKKCEYYFSTQIWTTERMELDEEGCHACGISFWAKRGVVRTQPEFLLAARYWKDHWREYFRRRNLRFVEPTLDELPPYYRNYPIP